MKLGWILWLASILGGNVQEQTCLATTVYLEARDQPIEGQYAVAEVALRRREGGQWGVNVCDVVKSSGQFAPTLLSRDYPVENARAWQRAWKVAGNSLQNWRLPAVNRKLYVPGATHFYAHDIANPGWIAYGEPVAVIGDHSFYRVDGVHRPALLPAAHAVPPAPLAEPAVLEHEVDAAAMTRAIPLALKAPRWGEEPPSMLGATAPRNAIEARHGEPSMLGWALHPLVRWSDATSIPARAQRVPGSRTNPDPPPLRGAATRRPAPGGAPRRWRSAHPSPPVAAPSRDATAAAPA